MNTCGQSNLGLRKAIKWAGSQTALAHLLGKQQPHVYKWLKSRNGLNPTYCAEIERITHGEVTRRDLRPNDWHLIWPELAFLPHRTRSSS